jgi:hypothetical protein
MTRGCYCRCYYSHSSTVPLGFRLSKGQYAAAAAAAGVPAAVAGVPAAAAAAAAVALSPSQLDAG